MVTGKNKKTFIKKTIKEKSFTVVAIGDSAGGLEAMSTLLKNLPSDTGMAFIYVQHLCPDHKSFQTSILSKLTKMKVQEIDNMELMKPNNVYIIPPNKEIKVLDGHIQLTPRSKKNATSTIIDILFSSLAQTHKDNTIGVILSGYANDGMAGLKAIKDMGGVTFAQDDSAQASSMPYSVIAAGAVDYILSPKEIAKHLVRLSKKMLPEKNRNKKQSEITVDSNPDLKTIFEILHKKKGVDFRDYKMPTIKKRLKYKMLLCGVETRKEYVNLLNKKTTEIDNLYNDLLINVTRFFRDKEVFAYLKRTLLPKIINSKKTGETLRIWVPACSTGEEVYSIAMLITELQDKKVKKIPIQIFATDLSEQMIAEARIGMYSKTDLINVSKKYVDRFFTKSGNSYQVVKELREMCVFAPHNILQDPPFSRMDFISCRNLLIYFDAIAQKRVFGTLHFTLNEGGYLLLGKAETTGISSLLFNQANNKFKVYSRKKDIGLRKIPELIPHFPSTNLNAKKATILTKNTSVNPTGIEHAIDTSFISDANASNEEFQTLKEELEISKEEIEATNEERLSTNQNLQIRNRLLSESQEYSEAIIASLIATKELEALNYSIKQASQYPRSLLEASLDPLVTINSNGKITDVNEALIKVTGVQKNALIGTDFSNYFTESEKAQEGYRHVFEKGFVADYPLTIKHKNGELTDVLYNASAFNDEIGNVLGVFAVARDITEQKSVENSLEKSLRENSDYKYALDEFSIVAITDQKGIIKYVNDNFCKISKYNRSELIGQDHRIINSGYHPKEFIRELWKTITNGKIWKGELYNRCKDGAFYWLDTTIVPFLNEKGKPYQYLSVRIDITEWKRIEKEFTEAKIAAELATEVAEEAKRKAENETQIAMETVKSKQQFLSNMSHEIRGPLNAIIGFTNAILKTRLDEKQKEYLDAIKVSGDALIVLINDILDLAKVDAGKMTLELAPFKLSSSISSLLHLFEITIQEKNLELVKEYDPAIPEFLLGDSARLNQILLNLISNAIKFTAAGKITVSVRMLKEETEEVTVEFAISDTGIGIHEKNLSTIFDAFQQATSETSRLYGGTGLGLAIVKKMVELKGGNISVKSKVGKGSTFSFILSFKKTDANEIICSSPDQDEEIKNVKVLVVENIVLNQLLMKTLLEEFGFDMDIADNGKIAIEKLKLNNYDIILMDLQMPEMNGFEATEYIRKTMNSQIPIIALTADVTTVDVEKCKAFKMNDYLAKPINEVLLKRKIIQLVKKKKEEENSVLKDQKNDQKKAEFSDHLKHENGNEGNVKESTTKKYIDLNYLKKLTKNTNGIIEMIEVYLEETPLLIDKLRQAIKTSDWESLRTTAHSLMPSFSMMGIDKEFEMDAKKIEEYAEMLIEKKNMEPAENEISVIKELFLKIEEVCIHASEELKIELIK